MLFSAALGKIKHSAKVALPSARHSVKPGSRQNWALPSAGRWPACDGGHLPSDFAECLTAGTRQIFFLILGPNFFLGPCASISNSILKFGEILTFFDIFH